MKKYIWLVVLALLVTLPVLAACGGGGAPAPTPAPTPAPEPAPISTPEPTPVQITSGPTLTPHPLEGRENCLMCHETGIGNATAVPADHDGRPNDLCATCHVPAGG